MEDMTMRIVALFLLVFAALVFCAANQAFSLEVRVLERAEVTGARITLGEVATFSHEADPRLPELKGIVLGKAPAPGKSLVLDRAFLVRRLGRLEGQRDLRLLLPAELQVTRQQGQRIGKDELERIFSGYVREHMRWSAEDVSIRDIMAPQSLSLPAGAVKHRIKPLGRTEYVGTVSLLVTFFIDGVEQQTVRVSGYVEVKRQVLVARRDLRRGQEIGKDMVTVKPMTLSGSAVTALSRPEEVMGMEPVQAIRTGEPILPSMLRETPVVRRGEQLVLIAESGNLKVTTTAKALENGYEGEQVRVTNAASGREILGRVIGPRRVLVPF
jgi:flagellar basal body P-ring formation protein FlgA